MMENHSFTLFENNFWVIFLTLWKNPLKLCHHFLSINCFKKLFSHPFFSMKKIPHKLWNQCKKINKIGFQRPLQKIPPTKVLQIHPNFVHNCTTLLPFSTTISSSQKIPLVLSWCMKHSKYRCTIYKIGLRSTLSS